VRIAMNEFLGADGLEPAEVRDVIAMLAELPDLWDLSLSAWSNDSQTSRFSGEGFQEPYIQGVKQLTTKPVVGVGRYTSPDAMVRVIKQGLMDLIGAARPSIADPFLPRKIEEGRLDDIRECIGCNVCVTGDMTMSPIRCTQNPSMGEEWRRGWHPERVPAAGEAKNILVIGAGPAGLEAARALGQRGHAVTIADQNREAGGRVANECRLPGLAAWGRVRDWRLSQIKKMPNVSLYLESRMTKEVAADFGADHIVCATGSHWRRDGTGRFHARPIAISGPVLTPDDLMSGLRPKGKSVVIFDDDHYYIGGILAELLRREDFAVTLVTPAALASAYTKASLEQHAIQTRLLNLDVDILANTSLDSVAPDHVELRCIFTGRPRRLPADATVMVTARDGDLTLTRQMPGAVAIGDCVAPSTIAAAVYAGRKFAEDFGQPPRDFLDPGVRREVTELS
jgi:dimethylamine/trimethylamine dehydrogenase